MRSTGNKELDNILWERAEEDAWIVFASTIIGVIVGFLAGKL